MSIICCLLGFWRSFGRSIGISGHELEAQPRYGLVAELGSGRGRYYVLICRRCGYESPTPQM